ncbi:unnamed protein product [Mytilus coruscus]|uniref:Uncharacterized protein n=1 Tax=Mytilus coruscus TaxID=42192 RepID=A0A6J8E9P6_MYTCO|nr:unnamed protein product [Mytilus coruscus]
MNFFKALMHAICIVTWVSPATTQYDFKCPHESHRMIRAHWHCKTAEENYSCLKDVRQDSYRESCLYKSDFVRMGQKYVIKGNRRNMNCTVNRYQPFKFYSSQLSKCAFMKTSCYEEGQLLFNPGSTKEDSTCGCDYTQGYTFLLRPRNIRFCMPEQEDCTCYVTTCPQNNELSSDYECTQDPMFPSFVPFIAQTKLGQNETVKNGNFDGYTYNLALPTGSYRIAAAVATCVTSMVAIALVLYYSYHVRMDYIRNIGDEIDGNHGEFNPEDSCKNVQKEVNNDNNKDSKNYCNGDDIERDSAYDEEEYTTTTRFAVLTDKLEKICSKLDTNIGTAICQIKSKGDRCEKVLNLLVAVVDCVKHVRTHEINIVEGVKLIKVISDTSNTICEDDIDCIQIPAALLKLIWPVRLMKIDENDKLPVKLNKEIVAVRKKFEKLDQSLNEPDDQHDSLNTVEDIAKFVEELQKKIKFLIYSKNTRTKNEVTRVQNKSHALIDLYMNIQFLRSAYCIRYCSRSSDNVDRMYKELKNIETNQKEFLQVFEQPTEETVAFFGLFYPSNYEFINDYMEVKGIVLQDLPHELDNQTFAIRPQRWLEHWAVMSNLPAGTIWSTKKCDNKRDIVFNFKSISKVDNIFLISPVQWPSWFMYMDESGAVRGQNEKKGPKREWKIVRLGEEKYMMCTRRWPSKFIYMDGGMFGKVFGGYKPKGSKGYFNLIDENEIHME